MSENKEKEALYQQKLADYRVEIDDINSKLISLLARRQDIAADIGKIKKELGQTIFNTGREAEIMRQFVAQKTENLPEEVIRCIFSEIISAARAVQQPLEVAYLGPEATFSHQAAIRLFGHSTSFRAAETIEDVFSFVEKGICHHGVVPIENSYEGSVSSTMDLFYRYELKISGEIFLRIRHNLLSQENSVEGVKHIYSHPMGIAQCRVWLRSNMRGISTSKVDSTALAAKMASEESGVAAIGSCLAAQTYGLNMLRENIEDHPDNVTRFLVMGKSDSEPTGKDKTSALFFLNHQPGALYHALESFSKNHINMTRIESRPMRIRNWEYLFFVDIEGHEKEKNVNDALSEMKKHCAILKRLGSYPAGGAPWD